MSSVMGIRSGAAPGRDHSSSSSTMRRAREGGVSGCCMPELPYARRYRRSGRVAGRCMAELPYSVSDRLRARHFTSSSSGAERMIAGSANVERLGRDQPGPNDGAARHREHRVWSLDPIATSTLPARRPAQCCDTMGGLGPIDEFIPAGRGGSSGPRVIAFKMKMRVCHRAPGDGGERTVSVGQLATADHVAHGDRVGACDEG